ncbi:hypothetical protein M752DRAFT_113317 [Aspergillus phoenicis ATCC 13157]|uniref:Uncharacterized protein n=2 Tax=Aspergillus TaxID=5052 RepID=A0A370P461_ASPPH|nr:hypothetical protein M747DRAFT_175689 [Aspergillus niger ATCC 13496]RDK36646.1 hypothetical protein M752DRAFT_113317 [Aspergillus phoenicis ATCC 13157]
MLVRARVQATIKKSCAGCITERQAPAQLQAQRQEQAVSSRPRRAQAHPYSPPPSYVQSITSISPTPNMSADMSSPAIMSASTNVGSGMPLPAMHRTLYVDSNWSTPVNVPSRVFVFARGIQLMVDWASKRATYGALVVGHWLCFVVVFMMAQQKSNYCIFEEDVARLFTTSLFLVSPWVSDSIYSFSDFVVIPSLFSYAK